MAGYCTVDDTIFSLSNILYTTLRASDEVYEVRALAGDVDLAGIVRFTNLHTVSCHDYGKAPTDGHIKTTFDLFVSLYH